MAHRFDKREEDSRSTVSHGLFNIPDDDGDSGHYEPGETPYLGETNEESGA